MRVFAAFMLETQVKSLKGNVAAGSADMGFVITPDAWECFKWAGRGKIDYQGWEYQKDKLGTDKAGVHVPEDQNEAVGCLTGFFFKKPMRWLVQRGMCARVRNAVAWKNAHIGPSNTYVQALSASRPVRPSTNMRGPHGAHHVCCWQVLRPSTNMWGWRSKPWRSQPGFQTRPWTQSFTNHPPVIGSIARARSTQRLNCSMRSSTCYGTNYRNS